MGILKNITSRMGRKQEKQEYKENVQEEKQEQKLNRKNVDMHDKMQRERYVKACLEQLSEASKELETLEAEYNMVTAKLTDMEEIEAMPPELKAQLEDIAKQVVELEKSQQKKKERKSVMSEEEYDHMERISEYMPDAIKKLKETEEYQTLVKNDLGRLDGEKQAYLFRKNELETNQRNMKGMTAICLGSMLLLIVLLSVLSSTMNMDVQLGYIIAVLISAAAMTLVYVKYEESKKELVRVEKAMNKLILLQNTVKIRYVNNTNLLEYLYMKYEVDHSSMLQKLWKKYEQEHKIREEEAQIRLDMDANQAALVRLLRRSKLQDPNIWVHQAQAIYDNQEMVEIRHRLIIRRQKLRKQMEYNAKAAQDAQEEVKDIVAKYPEYAQRILDMVSEYEAQIA